VVARADQVEREPILLKLKEGVPRESQCREAEASR